MSNMVLWTELGEAADDLTVACGVYAQVPTDRQRAVMISAYHDYATVLYPVVGHAMAWQFETSMAAMFEATGAEEKAAAQQAHAAVMVDLEAAIERAIARRHAANGS